MQPARLTLNTLKLDVNYNLHCKSSHIMLLEARARKLPSDKSHTFSVRSLHATPRISFKNFTWADSQPVSLKPIQASIRTIYNPPTHNKSKTMLSPLPKLRKVRLRDLFGSPSHKSMAARKRYE